MHRSQLCSLCHPRFRSANGIRRRIDARAGQSAIQALNREQPGSGFGAIDCGPACGLLTLRWLRKNAAEARSEVNTSNSALTAKGLTQVESGGDFAIVGIEMTKNQRTLNTFYNGFGGGWRWGGGFGNATTTVDNYKVGTLVVDLFDANSKKLIWRGSSVDTLSDKSDKNIKNLDRGVQKMFEHFPPGAKK
jgi:hypothetical protein